MDVVTPSNLTIEHELPVLRLGIAGFTGAEEAALCVAMADRARRRQIPWQLAALGEADAWCVNGSRVQRLPDGTLRIIPGLPSGRSIRINLEEVDWPIAFSLPAGPPDFHPTYTFDSTSPDSFQAVLDQIEGWLRPLMVQFYLASYIVQSNLDLRSGVYHVSVNGKLYAMVSPRSGVGVWALARASDLTRAVWSHRPESADSIPAFFVRTEFPELMWQYANRTGRDCLPPHYRTSQLFLRRPPRLPMRLLTDPSLLIVRELGSMPGTLADLAQRTGIAAAQLARHVAALYMLGSVTANRKRLEVQQGTPDSASAWNASSCPADGALGAAGAEMTVRLKAAAPGSALPQ